jgi:hypothetical protein
VIARRAAAAAFAALAAAAFGLAACGGDEVEPAAVGEMRAGSVVTLANCGDWRGGTVQERLATIAQVRAEASPSSDVPEHSDEQIYDLFQRACAPDYASTFRLYKLYSRSAPFIEPDG